MTDEFETMAYRDPPPPPPVRPRARPGWPVAALLVLAAFVGGALAAGWAARNWQSVAALVRPVPARPVVSAVRVVRVPIATPVAQASPALAAEVQRIDSKLDDVDARARAAVGNAGRAEGLLVAFAARRAIERGVELGYLEGLLREHFAAAQPRAVATVISAARQPVTLAELRSGLAEARPVLTTGGESVSSWAAVRRELAALVVVRRAGAEAGVPTARFDRATTALESGQVDAALAEVARMPGRDRAAGWIAGARRYLAVRAALDQLETAALTEPAPPPMPGPTTAY